MSDLGVVTRKLADIQDRLIRLPDDAYGEKLDLLAERALVKAEVTELAASMDHDNPDEVLLNQLAALRARAKEIERNKIDLVGQAGGGSQAGGNSNLDGIKLNRDIERAHGLAAIRSRIGAVKGILIDRGVDIPEAG